jgi:hypothetical protein
MEINMIVSTPLELTFSELAEGGWAGLAWSCLRRNWRYKRACQRVADGEISERQASRRFGLLRFKPADERYATGSPPQFDPVRILHGERVRPVIRKSAVAVVLSLNHSIVAQLQLAGLLLEKKGLLDNLAPLKLRRHSEMVQLAAPALVAYELHRQGWGPTKIGVYLYPDLCRSKAKTKARDVVSRGKQYVEHGYLTFAVHHLLDAHGVRRVDKPNGDADREARERGRPSRAGLQGPRTSGEQKGSGKAEALPDFFLYEIVRPK